MKKQILCSGLLMLSCISAVHTHGQSLGFDRHVNNHINQQLDAPDMAIAFDGRIYNAHRSGDGIVIKVSLDHGKSWQHFQSISMPGYSYDALLLWLPGITIPTLRCLLQASSAPLMSTEKSVFVHKYNAETHTFISEPFVQSTTGDLYACDLASSYPTSDKDFNISLLYATGSGNTRTLLQKTSVDGGNSFAVSNTVTTSKAYFRNVALCYGKSDNASNGRYFMAWDEYASPKAAWGKVYTSRNASTITQALLCRYVS